MHTKFKSLQNFVIHLFLDSIRVWLKNILLEEMTTMKTKKS